MILIAVAFSIDQYIDYLSMIVSVAKYFDEVSQKGGATVPRSSRGPFVVYDLSTTTVYVNYKDKQQMTIKIAVKHKRSIVIDILIFPTKRFNERFAVGVYLN